MTIQEEFPVTIQAPPSVVWPWVSQLEKHAQWSTKPYRFEWISGEPNAVGSRYRSEGVIPGDRHHRNEGTITVNDPEERFALDADDPLGVFRNTYTVRDAGDGTTEVTFRVEFPQMHGLARLMSRPAFAMIGRPDTRKRMQLLKRTVEAEATG
jgi:uncharacterized protein YndB with AHSA1/START domain